MNDPAPVRNNVHLGLGLIGLGRPWGHAPAPVPDEAAALAFLAHAHRRGITFYDTAASYGDSEARLGRFLAGLAPAERGRLTVATKFGDHWNRQHQTAYVDHSFHALRDSFDRSLALLGRVDLLQLHKTTPAALRSRDVERAFDHARARGVPHFGASVSDLVSGRLVCDDPRFTCLQFPFNAAHRALEELFERATAAGKGVLVNRPFQMGALLHVAADGRPPEARCVEAFRLILEKPFTGFILTGTRDRDHLDANQRAFEAAWKRIGAAGP